MKINRQFWAGIALSALLAAPAFAEDVTADTVVATVNGTNITLGNIIAARETLPEQYKSLADDVLFKGILDQLIQQTLLEQSMGDTVSKHDQLVLENQKRDYLSSVVLRDVVAAGVTEEAIKAAYDERMKDYKPQTEYNAAHILVDTEEKAKELLTQLEGGADFAELAKANSTDTGSGANGGDLGWFGPGMMVKPFEDAVLAAEVGKVAGPVQTDYGWHLILVKETRVAAQPTLEDLRQELSTEVQNKLVAAHIDGLTASAEITKPGEGIDPALIRDLTLLDK